MRRLTVLAALVASCVLLAAVAAGSAGAATNTFTFENCQGPTGITSFAAVKTSLPDSAAHLVSAAIAYRLTGSSAVFIVLKFGDFWIAKGLANTNLATTSCTVHFSNPDLTETLSGFFAP